MKKVILFFLICQVIVFTSIGQQQHHSPDQLSKAYSYLEKKGEVYFSFNKPEKLQFEKILHVISIDKVTTEKVFAYANEWEFESFLSEDIPFEVLNHPGDVDFELNMLSDINVKDINEWDFYPTYEAYESMMAQFETNFPDKCKIYNIKTLASGRKLLFAKVTSNINQPTAKTRFMYTSTMHGDEATGYILMLRLIDYFLNNYGTNAKVTYILDNMELWICPAENPDGTYAGGNSSVNGSTRYNANGVDLNRNYPNPVGGTNPSGPHQPETVAMMSFTDTMGFVMSANFHGGAECINYPWDSWLSNENLHADNLWWQMVSHEYADTVHLNSPSTYMSEFDNGVTHGGDWYVVYGSRQDFMGYYRSIREVTVEISNTKLIPASQLPAHWNYNYRSLINYIYRATIGLKGTVTDAVTGEPVKAKVFINNYDIEEDNSYVFSREDFGNYYRPLKAGTYSVTFSAEGYGPQTFTDVVIQNNQATELNVQLQAGFYANFSADITRIPEGGTVNFVNESYGSPTQFAWAFEGGSPATSNLENPSSIQYNQAGTYDVNLTISKTGMADNSFVRPDYIEVLAVTSGLSYNISNTVVASCSGTFYDTGGASSGYESDENFLMTFIPGVMGDKLKFVFTAFDVEENSTCNYDWLKIYDGPDASYPLLGTWCGTNSPGTVQATNVHGALTFQFHSDGSETGAGWVANFSCIEGERKLSLNIHGEGSVDRNPDGNSIDGAYYYPVGTEVALSATPAEGYEFSKWVKDGVDYTENVMNVTMDENIAIDVYFQSLNTAVVTVQKEGEGTVTPAPGQYTHEIGSQITFESNPANNWEFVKWLVGTQEVTTPTYVHTVAADVTVKAVFEFIDNVQEHALQNVNVFPVPASSDLKVEASAIVNTATIIDLNGRTVIELNPQAASFSLNVNGLSDGIYFLRLMSGNDVSVKRIEIKK